MSIDEIIKAYYPRIYGYISSIEQINAYEINSKNFRFFVSDETGFLLKEFLDIKNVPYILRTIQNCFLDGSKVPEIIKTKKNKLFAKKDDKIYCLFKYYKGDEFNKTIKQIRETGKNLGVLHKSLKKNYFKINRDARYNFLDERLIENIKNKIKSKHLKDEFDIKFLGIIHNVKEFYKDNKKALRGVEFPKQLIHGDFHPKNVIFNGDKLRVILDFGAMHFSERVKDVAFSCHRFASLVPNKNAINEFKDSYLSENGLTDDEINFIPEFIKKEALHRISYILKSHYFENDTKWDFDLDKHIKFLNGVDITF